MTINNNTSANQSLRVEGLSHSYGDHQVLKDLSFEVEAGQFVSVVGPSGAGKSTLLQCLTGLRRPTTGDLSFRGERIDGTPRGMSIVFQDYSRSLMPWMSVADNVGLPLKSAGLNKTDRAARVQRALAEVGLAGNDAKYPWQLSGGMQQRVAIARALAFDPAAIVMDEPFASVDAQTRSELEDLVLRVRDHLGIMVLLVTHDIDEAVYLADRVLVLAGRPATLAADLLVDLPVPRHQVRTKALPLFGELRGEVLNLIQGNGAAQEAPQAAARA